MKGITRAFLEIMLLVIFPLLLALLELFHPIDLHAHVFETLNPMHHEWLFIHYAQSFMFALMTIAAYYFTRNDNDNILVWLIRINLFIFIVTYTVMDASAGIAVGRLLTYSATYQINPAIINEIVQYLFNDPIIGGNKSIYSLAGSITWLVAILLTVVVLGIKLWKTLFWQASPALLLLLVSGYSLYRSHASPYGPIAFTAFALASAWLLYLRKKTQNNFF